MTSYMAQVVGALVPREIKLIHLLDIPTCRLARHSKAPPAFKSACKQQISH